MPESKEVDMTQAPGAPAAAVPADNKSAAMFGIIAMLVVIALVVVYLLSRPQEKKAPQAR